MIKVLYFVDRLLGGGIQSFLKTICSQLPKDEFDISLLTLDDGKDYKDQENEFFNLGVKVFKLDNIWLNYFHDYFGYKKKTDEFFCKHSFDIVHINSGPKNYIIGKYAKKHGIKHIVYHSHNTNYQTKNLMKKAYGDFLKNKVKKYSDYYLACSHEAGEWMFSEKILASDKFQVLHNPIFIEGFIYDEGTRDSLRNDLDLKDSFVLGNVGRLIKQKNQLFLIQIMKSLVEKKQNVKLLLAGTGSLEKELREAVEKYGIEKNVMFLGFRNDVGRLLNAIDLLVLTSKHEGYPIISIEAQANGLPCLMSDIITKEALLHDKSSNLKLIDPPSKWADFIIENYINQKYNRSMPTILNEYSSTFIVNKLVAFYKKILN